MENPARKKKQNRRKLESDDEEDVQVQVANPESEIQGGLDNMSEDVDYSKLSNTEIEKQLAEVEANINQLASKEATSAAKSGAKAKRETKAEKKEQEK